MDNLLKILNAIQIADVDNDVENDDTICEIDDSICQIEYYPNGNVLSKMWYDCDDSICEIEYYPNGNVSSKKWYDNDDQEHRIGGPAVIFYSENGMVDTEIWKIHGIRHRIGKPAFIMYMTTGDICYQSYHENGNVLNKK